LRIPVGDLDAWQLRRTSLAKADFDPDEPRLPKGDPHGGEWTAGDDAGDAAPSGSPSSDPGAGTPSSANQTRSDNQQVAGEALATLHSATGLDMWTIRMP